MKLKVHLADKVYEINCGKGRLVSHLRQIAGLLDWNGGCQSLWQGTLPQRGLFT